MKPGSLARDGFRIHEALLSDEERRHLLRVFDDLKGAGRRDGLAVSAVRALARNRRLRELVEAELGAEAFAIRATLFDKTRATNWLVAWHQDLTIAVAERREVTGYGPWSRKGDVDFVEPPPAILERLLAVRVDLDGSDQDNGALRVIPRSHLKGRLGTGDREACAASARPFVCVVPAGGCLLMRPLILHASSRTSRRRHRRIIHLEFAAEELAAGLQWHARV